MQITEDRLNDVIKNPAGFKSEKSTIKFFNKGVNLKGNDGKLCEVLLWEGFRKSRRCPRETYQESCVTEYTLVYEDNFGFRG